MVGDIDAFGGDELENLKAHVKSEEEIKKYCTNEDFNETKRAVHLMKKGYMVQKISVINHLDRYLREPGANEELMPILLDSLTSWEENLQIECAKSFVKPVEEKLMSQKNI